MKKYEENYYTLCGIKMFTTKVNFLIRRFKNIKANKDFPLNTFRLPSLSFKGLSRKTIFAVRYLESFYTHKLWTNV